MNVNFNIIYHDSLSYFIYTCFKTVSMYKLNVECVYTEDRVGDSLNKYIRFKIFFWGISNIAW